MSEDPHEFDEEPEPDPDEPAWFRNQATGAGVGPPQDEEEPEPDQDAPDWVKHNVWKPPQIPGTGTCRKTEGFKTCVSLRVCDLQRNFGVRTATRCSTHQVCMTISRSWFATTAEETTKATS